MWMKYSLACKHVEEIVMFFLTWTKILCLQLSVTLNGYNISQS